MRAYLGDNIDKYLTHPYVSPLFGDMRGLPPLLIQCGDAEVLRDEITLLAHKASMAGVAVRHELYEDCVHVFQAFLFLDASRKALQSARHFVRTALDRRGKRKAEVRKGSRSEMDKEMRKGMENERGEEVEPSTGEKRGSWKEARKGVESDNEGAERGVPDRSDDEWDEFDGRTKADGVIGAAQPAKLAAKMMGAGDEKVTERQAEDNAGGSSSTANMEQSKSHVHEALAPTPSSSASSSPRTTKRRQESTPPSPIDGRPRRAGSSASLSSMTLEQARNRAQAGLRLQESKEAPHLSKFHQPQRPLHPRMRRSASNVAVNDLVKSWESGHGTSGLNTRVYTPSEQQERR